MNHMYGSPFPTINPKVRYRTALERAGFDVNYGGDQGVLGPRRPMEGETQPTGQWGAGSPRVGSKADVRSQQASPSVYNKMAGYQYPTVGRDASGTYSVGFASNPGTRIPSRTSTERPEMKSATFQKSRVPSNPIEVDEELDPIERSFMMLTQNDVSSSVDAVGHTAPAPNECVRESSASSLKRESEVFGRDPKTVAAGRDTVYSTVESLNFAPSSELHAGLASPPQDTSNLQSNGPSFLPSLTVTTHFDETTGLVADLMTEDDTKCQNTTKTQPNEENTEIQEGVRFSVEVQTPQTASNTHVKELLAQLDDISYTKNAQLDSSIFAATAANSSVGSQLDVRSLSVDRSRSCSNSSSRFKKSSAYLSQLPGVSYDVSSQSLTHDDDSLNSCRAEDSPVFYKFRTPQNDDFAQPKEQPRIVIEPLQLSHKDSTGKSKDRTPSASPNEAQSNSEDFNEPPADIAAEPSPAERPIHKYPPGKGPCRACQKEVNSKRIFSKKENELSGQWHRECFRCLTCNVKFNKRIPCYILDDEPYCQQHYHEENGSICLVCQGFIEGECLENDRTERFHVHCLTCFLCRARITDDYFIYNSELPLCSNHDIEALLRDGLAGGDLPDGQDNTVSKRRTRMITLGQT